MLPGWTWSLLYLFSNLMTQLVIVSKHWQQMVDVAVKSPIHPLCILILVQTRLHLCSSSFKNNLTELSDRICLFILKEEITSSLFRRCADRRGAIGFISSAEIIERVICVSFCPVILFFEQQVYFMFERNSDLSSVDVSAVSRPYNIHRLF